MQCMLSRQPVPAHRERLTTAGLVMACVLPFDSIFVRQILGVPCGRWCITNMGLKNNDGRQSIFRRPTYRALRG
jgi:hypothetical protein